MNGYTIMIKPIYQNWIFFVCFLLPVVESELGYTANIRQETSTETPVPTPIVDTPPQLDVTVYATELKGDVYMSLVGKWQSSNVNFVLTGYDPDQDMLEIDIESPLPGEIEWNRSSPGNISVGYRIPVTYKMLGQYEITFTIHDQDDPPHIVKKTIHFEVALRENEPPNFEFYTSSLNFHKY